MSPRRVRANELLSIAVPVKLVKQLDRSICSTPIFEDNPVCLSEGNRHFLLTWDGQIRWLKQEQSDRQRWWFSFSRVISFQVCPLPFDSIIFLIKPKSQHHSHYSRFFNTYQHPHRTTISCFRERCQLLICFFIAEHSIVNLIFFKNGFCSFFGFVFRSPHNGIHSSCDWTMLLWWQDFFHFKQHGFCSASATDFRGCPANKRNIIKSYYFFLRCCFCVAVVAGIKCNCWNCME